jgi:hypothetical protein
MQTIKETRHHDIKSDYGLNDYFRFYKNNGGKLPKNKFREIIYTFNTYVQDVIAEGIDYILPKRLGKICIRKYETYLKFDSETNTVRTNRPIDHKATKELHTQHPETKEQGLLVRRDEPYIYKIRYVKHRAVYKNKTIYNLCITRDIKQKLKLNIRNNNVGPVKLITKMQ